MPSEERRQNHPILVVLGTVRMVPWCDSYYLKIVAAAPTISRSHF